MHVICRPGLHNFEVVFYKISALITREKYPSHTTTVSSLLNLEVSLLITTSMNFFRFLTLRYAYCIAHLSSLDFFKPINPLSIVSSFTCETIGSFLTCHADGSILALNLEWHIQKFLSLFVAICSKDCKFIAYSGDSTSYSLNPASQRETSLFVLINSVNSNLRSCWMSGFKISEQGFNLPEISKYELTCPLVAFA